MVGCIRDLHSFTTICIDNINDQNILKGIANLLNLSVETIEEAQKFVEDLAKLLQENTFDDSTNIVKQKFFSNLKYYSSVTDFLLECSKINIDKSKRRFVVI